MARVADTDAFQPTAETLLDDHVPLCHRELAGEPLDQVAIGAPVDRWRGDPQVEAAVPDAVETVIRGSWRGADQENEV
jgi:hypothetical protein